MNIDTTTIDKEEISQDKIKELAYKSYANKVDAINSTSSDQLVDKADQLASPRKSIDENNNYFRIFSALVLAASFGAAVFFVASFYQKLSGGTNISHKNTEATEKTIIHEKVAPEDKLKAELAFAQQNQDLQPKPQMVVEETKPEQTKPEETKPVASSPEIQSSAPIRESRPEIEKEPDPLEQWAFLASIGTSVSSNRIEQELQAKVETKPEEIIENNARSRSNFENTLVADHQAGDVHETDGREIAKIASVSIGEGLIDTESTKSSQLDLNNPEVENLLSDSSNFKPGSYLDRKAKQYREQDRLALLASNGVSSSNFNTPKSNNYLKSQASLNRASEHSQVPFGTTVKGELSSSLVWSEGADSTDSRAKITLSEPLLDSSGNVALDAGSSLIAEVTSIQESGLTTLQVIAVSYVDKSGNLKQEIIPPETISIRGENNQPLIADRVNNSGGTVLAQDILLGALGAGERGFEVLNEPSSSSTVFPYTNNLAEDFFPDSISTEIDRDANLLTGAAEGVFNTTKERLEQRSEQILEDKKAENPIYELKAKTSVSIFVNSFLEIKK